MSRRTHLEGNIRRSYQLVLEYEAIEGDTGRPEERLRAQRMRHLQWRLIEGHLAEYLELCRKLSVEPAADLAELAASRAAQQLAVADEGQAMGGAAADRSLVGAAPAAPHALPLKLFFSYSHRDEKLRDHLSNHLAALEREGLIAGWHDRRIGAGEEWVGEIDSHLSSADLILLLVSPSFVASRYCYDMEMQRALARDTSREARVIPVILRPVDWQSLPFGKLQALPKDGKPVTRWSNRDQAFLDIAQGIRRAAQAFVIAVRGQEDG
jgi:hypothetical protein